MERTRHALPKVAVVALAVACGTPAKPAPPVAQVPVVVDAGPLPVADAGAPVPAPPRVRRDCALQPGQISDDETPVLAGNGKSERALDWLAAHGVANVDAIKWYVLRTGRGMDAEHAEIALGEARCIGLNVGPESGILCETSSLDRSMHMSALGIMVRNKKPVAVLDLGLGTIAMDFPDAHGLDLQVVVAADGKTLELRERAPDGAQLVAPPSECIAHEKMLDECTERLAAGQGDVSLCPIATDPATGQKTLITRGDEPTRHGIYPAKMHDCAGAKRLVAEALKKSGPEAKADIQRDGAFIARSCAARGKYVWANGRYVKAN